MKDLFSAIAIPIAKFRIDRRFWTRPLPKRTAFRPPHGSTDLHETAPLPQRGGNPNRLGRRTAGSKAIFTPEYSTLISDISHLFLTIFLWITELNSRKCLYFLQLQRCVILIRLETPKGVIVMQFRFHGVFGLGQNQINGQGITALGGHGETKWTFVVPS